jgi:hypothetical protein
MDKVVVGAMDADKVVALGDSCNLAALDSQSAQISWFPSFVLSVNEVSSMDIYHLERQLKTENSLALRYSLMEPYSSTLQL